MGADNHGASVYLMLLDPDSLRVVWANENVEDVVRARGQASPAGRDFREVVPYADELGLPEKLRSVARTGEPEYTTTLGISSGGHPTRTSASMYRFPSGQLLVATEYVEGP